MAGSPKPDRIELRGPVSKLAASRARMPTQGRGAACLWPHACFDCRKSWKLSVDSTGKCPECSGALHWMGRAFKPPRKADKGQWAKVRALWLAGFRFINHTRWREAEPFPTHVREVEAFARRNPDHPFRVGR